MISAVAGVFTRHCHGYISYAMFNNINYLKLFKLSTPQFNLTFIKRKIKYCNFLILGIFVACSPRPVASNNLYTYVPDSQELHDKIVAMDSIFFNAYNTCNLVVMEKLYSDSIEFYHDKGGLTTSKPEIMEGTKRNG